METQKKQSLTNGEPFSLTQLDNALRDVFDLLDDCSLETIVLGDTALGVRQNKLFGDKITVGIKNSHLTRNVKSIINMRMAHMLKHHMTNPIEWDDNHILYSFGGVPIEIKIIHRNYAWFKNMDLLTYFYDNYRIPNPFDKYFKARFIVQ